MSVIIRLQNLPWSANALDIRQFFHGLSIPEGGVHIVGGELGDAFIAFSTDEDARQAFLRNNGRIREVQITLMLSSRTEMQKVIEAARAQSYAAFTQSAPAPIPTPAAVLLPAAVPAVVPAAVPEVRRESKDKDKVDRKDRRRSRSKSRDRRERSRDRKDRRYRERSRTRSRDRKSRNRRGRSRSKGRSHSKERDRRSRDRRKRSEDRSVPPFQKDKKQDSWPRNLDNSKPNMNSGSPIIVLDDPKNPQQEQMNGFPGNNFQNENGNSNDNWPKKPNNFGNARFNNDSYQQNQQFPPNRFRNNFGGRYRGDINPKQGCVAVEPFFGGYSDIRRFFNGLFISNRGIKFINDENGRKTGLVLVQFGGTSDSCVEQALSLNGQNLNDRMVSVTLINEEEFDAAVDRYTPSQNNSQQPYQMPRLNNRVFTTKFSANQAPEADNEKYTCLIVDELPNYCKEQDILHMFSQHPLVALILTPKKRGGHIAYVKFGSPEVAKKALEEKSQHFVSGKPVVVKTCKDKEFEEINKAHEVEMNISKDITPEQLLKTDCISVSQLPLKIIDKDIADFFSDIGIIPTKIHLMSNDMGFTGQAYCEFMNTEDSTKAIKKNNSVLGNDTIKVVPIDRAEMLNILGQTIPAPEPMEVTPRPLLSPNNPGPMPPMAPFNPRMQRPPFFNRFDGPNRGPMRFGPRGGPGGPPRPRFPQPQDGDDTPPGCTVFMNNVPYKAGTGEILDLFEGFNHTGNVSRRYNANNKPSDEAKITFYDADEASRAVRELNKSKIWDRIIFFRQE